MDTPALGPLAIIAALGVRRVEGFAKASLGQKEIGMVAGAMDQ